DLVPGAVEVAGKDGHRQAVEIDSAGRGLAGLFQAATVHGDEAGAEALHAGIILVATRLVDLALAPVLGFPGQYRHAKRLLAAVAAAFADQRVDEDALLRVFHLAALAPAPLFGRAGLVVDQHGNAGNLAHALLQGIQLIAMNELDAVRKDLRPGP